MLPGDRAAACGSPSIDAIARAVTACEPGRCGVKTGELVLSALRAAGMHCMAKPFEGLAGLAGQPVFLVSLSGGGFRASLYHAGVLRVLHEVGLLVAWRQVLVNAVSGGAIPALIWDTYLRSAAIDRLWPEQALLELVTSVPRLGGRYNWTLRTHNAWEQFLRRWWRNRTGAVCLADDISPITMVELLDYLAGGIFVFCGTHLNKPDREFFKSGKSKESWFLPNMTRKDAAPFAMPRPPRFRSTSGPGASMSARPGINCLMPGSSTTWRRNRSCHFSFARLPWAKSTRRASGSYPTPAQRWSCLPTLRPSPGQRTRRRACC